jgi:hypothetical protein
MTPRSRAADIEDVSITRAAVIIELSLFATGIALSIVFAVLVAMMT